MTGDSVAGEAHVELWRPAEGASDDASLHATVTACVSNLIAELALPLKPSPNVSVENGPFRVAVNGCRVPLSSARAEFRLHPSPEARFAEAIHARAELLVTPAVATTLWGDWKGPRDDEPDEFADLLARLVRHWVRPDRIANAVANWGARDAGTLFEDALCEAGDAVRVVVDADTYAAVHSAWEGAELTDGEVAAELFLDLGVILGEPRLELDEALPEQHFAVAINDGRTLPAPCVAPGRVLVDDTPARLLLMNVEAEPAVKPTTGDAALAADDQVEMLEAAGLATWTASQYLLLALGATARRHAGKLFTRDVLEYLVGALEPLYAVLPAQVSELGGPDRLTPVLRRLLDEQVSVRDLVRIVESIHGAPVLHRLGRNTLAFAPRPYLPSLSTARESDAVEDQMAEAARIGLASALSDKQTRGTGTLVVYLLDPEIEARVEDPTPLSDHEHEVLVDAIAQEADYLPPTALLPAILTRVEVRWRLAHALRAAFPTLAVLAHEQVAPNFNIQPVARISLVDGGFG